MSFNIDKTVAMVFAPKQRRWIVRSEFPRFKINNVFINFVSQFKYFGHIISDNGRDDRHPE